MQPSEVVIDFNRRLLFFLLGVAAIGTVPAFAEPFNNIEHGINYDKKLLSISPDGTRTYEWVSVPDRIFSNGEYKNYIVTEDVDSIILETANSGSIIFSKATCAYDLYDSGYITQQSTPKINDISWTVKGKLNSSSTWSNVNTINNAICSASVSAVPDKVTITGTKTNGAGTFQIVLEYEPGLGIKETMRAYNNNPAWNNHNIGFTEKFQVPRVIHFGAQMYDLANYNNTVLSRDWIENNKAKIIKLNNSFFYDFGIGFANLNDIKITWDGTKAYLSLNYLYPTQIVPYQTWFEVDPTFGPSTGTNYRIETTGAAGAACPGSPYTKTVANGRAERQDDTDPAGQCFRAITAFDVTTVSDSIGAISTMNVTTTTSAPVNMGTETCDMYRVMGDPSTASAQSLWFDLQSHTRYVSSNTQCRTAQTFTMTLSSNATTEFINSVRAGNNTFSIGFKSTSETRGAVGHSITFGTTQLKVVYQTGSAPNAVTTLTATGLATNAIDLAWSTPTTNNSTITGYQINYTTPLGSPNTILVNNASAGSLSYTVSNLEESTPYSFRVGVRSNLGDNMSGNIANATSGLRAANFTIGSIELNATNPNITPIRFERYDLNDTATVLKVIYDDSYNMACDFEFEFAGTNRSYFTLAPTVYDTSHEYTNFTFLDPQDEIIKARCWDQTSNATGRYVMTQSAFPLLDMVNNFRNGTYGTQGMIGAFDFITLAVIIFSMIGFNRLNEALGAIINVSLLGALAYFEIITLPTIIFGAIAVIMMVMIAQTRKD